MNERDIIMRAKAYGAVKTPNLRFDEMMVDPSTLRSTVNRLKSELQPFTSAAGLAGKPKAKLIASIRQIRKTMRPVGISGFTPDPMIVNLHDGINENLLAMIKGVESGDKNLVATNAQQAFARFGSMMQKLERNWEIDQKERKLLRARQRDPQMRFRR